MSLKAGMYAALPIAWELGASDGGNPQVAVVFQVIEHETENGRTRTWYGSFSDKAAKRTLESLRYCGLKGDDLIAMDGMGDRKVRIELEVDDYKGQKQLKVAWVNRYDTGTVQLKNVMDDKQRRAFAAVFKKQLGAINELPALPSNDKTQPKFDDDKHTDDEGQNSDSYYADDPGASERPTF